MAFRDTLRSLTPAFLLKWYRGKKKEAVRAEIDEQRNRGEGWSTETLVKQLRDAGIKEGDTLLVHSSLSKMGYVNGGPQAVVDAFLKAVGAKGHVLMPNSPNAGYQLEYIRSLEVFDAAQSPSALGAITETFRKQPGAVRSISATEPVSCIGPDANWFTEGHFGKQTPYTSDSPFFRVAESGGKILYVGVTLANAGTSLHLLEDAVHDFPYPVYYPELFEIAVKLPDGTVQQVQTKVHNPEQSAKRRCDELIPLFEREGALRKITVGNAETLLLDARLMLEVMLEHYYEAGVTMYTPFGTK